MTLGLATLLAQKVLLVISFLLYLFWTWKLGRIWGFHKEKILDLALITPASGILTYLVFSKLGFASESTFLIGCLAFVMYFTEKNIWSGLKIGDIFALSISIASIFYPFFPSFLFNIFSALCFYILFRVSKEKPRSGFVFFTFLCTTSIFVFALSFWKYRTILSLNTVLSLVGLMFGVLSLKKKEYKLSMDLLKYSLPSELLENLKKKLLDKKKNLEGEEKTLVSENVSIESGDQKSSEEQDMALVDQERDKNSSILDLIDSSKKDVDSALKRMEKGNYGLCDNCHKPIDKARLEAFPETNLCLDCAPKEEVVNQ